VRAERISLGDPADVAGAVRALVPVPASVTEDVRKIVEAVREGGDAALAEHVRRLDRMEAPVRVPPGELDEALQALDPVVRAGLKLAAANVRTVADAGLAQDRDVALPEGHHVLLRELPVRRAAIYAPGGRAPYPSSVVMGVVTARAAGVAEIAVCVPGGHPVMLAACALTRADEVYRMGGAHAVAALAYGTETIPRVDVIAGPGNVFVQEAKRLVSGAVGIDGFAGPSDVLVVADGLAPTELVALDLLAQAEHGDGTIVAACSDSAEVLDAVGERLAAAGGGGAVGERLGGAVAALIHAPDLEAALAFAEAFAPEHLELIGPAAEALAPRVRSAGCVFVGAAGATAFGDYVAGSNHILPTGGAARFASGLSPRHFRRRMTEVHVGDAAPALARAGIPIAEAEGFVLHAESMRVRENPTS
jgi:histidinol dehydrogenase